MLLELADRLERVRAAPVRAHAVRQRQHVLAVRFGDTEQRTDHQYGELVSEELVIVHRLRGVAVVRGLHVVEAAVGELLDPALEQVRALGREARRHQPPQPNRLRFEIDAAHRCRVQRGIGHAGGVLGVRVRVVAEATIRKGRTRLGVGDDQPRRITCGRDDLHDRCLRPQQSVQRRDLEHAGPLERQLERGILRSDHPPSRRF